MLSVGIGTYSPVEWAGSQAHPYVGTNRYKPYNLILGILIIERRDYLIYPIILLLVILKTV